MKCKVCGGTGTSNTCVNGTFKPCTFCDGTGEYEPFDLDVELDKLYPTELTNEEWFDGLSTEEKAEFLSKIDMPFMDKAPFPCGDLIECSKNCGLYSRCVKDDFPTNKEVWVEWLKQPHTHQRSEK